MNTKIYKYAIFASYYLVISKLNFYLTDLFTYLGKKTVKINNKAVEKGEKYYNKMLKEKMKK